MHASDPVVMVWLRVSSRGFDGSTHSQTHIQGDVLMDVQNSYGLHTKNKKGMNVHFVSHK